MKYFYIFLLSILLPFIKTKKIVKPIKQKICTNCKHFEYNNNMNNKIGICKLFPIHEKYYLINNTPLHF
jgi:hypothetical protein